MSLINEILELQTVTVKWDKVSEIPEFKKLEESEQNPYWHGEGNAMNHTKAVVEEMYKLYPVEDKDCVFSYGPAADRYHKRIVMVLAALFHDIGKGETTRWSEAKETWESPHHAAASEKITRRLLWDEDFMTREQVCNLVGNHMKPLYIFKSENPVAKVIELSENIVPLKALFDLKTADCLGSQMKEYDGWKEQIENAKNIALDYGCFYESYKFFNLFTRRNFYNTGELDNKNNIDGWDEPNNQFFVHMLIGLPGSGKTTLRNKLISESKETLPVICRDDIRTEIGIGGEKPMGTKEQERQVTEIANERILECARKRQSFIIDQTSLNKYYREQFRELLKEYNPIFVYHYVEAATFEETIKRRDGQIDREVIERMQKNFDFPRHSECEAMFIYKEGRSYIKNLFLSRIEEKFS